MNVYEPYKISNIDLDNIVFKKTKSISTNKKVIFLKYKDNKLNNFVIQLSKIKNNNVNNQDEIEFIINDESYIDFFENLDDFIVKKATQNHMWFDHLEDISSMNYQRIIRDDNSIKLRLCNNKDLITKLIINDDVVSNFDNVNSNESTTKMILEVYAIWIKSNNFGLLLRPINILMKIKETIEYNYKFLEESDNESNVSELLESHFQSEYNNDYESTSDNDENDESSISNDECVNNNYLFIKTNNIFANNITSLSSSNNSEDNLNKLILG